MGDFAKKVLSIKTVLLCIGTKIKVAPVIYLGFS